MSLQQWLPAQDAPEVPVNENFEALAHVAVYAKDATTTTGLTWGYLGGRWGGFTITPGTLTLMPNSTLYITASRSTGAVSVSDAATAWDNVAGHARIYKLTTGAATVTAVEDYRAGQGGVHGISGASGALAGLSDVNIGTPTDGQVLVYSASLGKWIPGAGGGGGGGGGRERLTADRTYYVSPTGSDTATGLSEAAALGTLAKAVELVVSTLDFAGKTVTIKLLAGTHAGATLLPWVGGGQAVLEGNTSAPSTVIVQSSSGNVVTAQGASADWIVRGFRVNATGAWGSGLYAYSGAWLRHANMVFGPCATAHIQLADGARANCTGSYTIAGAAPVHVRQYAGSTYTHNGTSIAVSAAVTFSSAFVHSTGGFCTFKNYTLTGSAVSGKRYTLELLALLDAGGASASFPGSTAGTTATGAQVA